MTRVGLLLALFFAAGLPLTAQAPAFEIVSVRPTQATDGVIRSTAGKFVADSITVLDLIEQAYDVYGFQIVNAPDWLDRAPPPGGQSRCRMRNGPNFTDAVGMPFSFLVGQVVGNVRRPVVDRTGLSGRFDSKYEWTTDLPAANAAGDRVSFITALQEQLGLRLVPARASAEALVIESVERPTPN